MADNINNGAQNGGASNLNNLNNNGSQPAGNDPAGSQANTDPQGGSQAGANAAGQQGSQQPGAGTQGDQGDQNKKGFLSGDNPDGDKKPGNTGDPANFEPYEISYPEGFVEDKETVEAVTPLLRGLGATQQQAQQLFDAGCKLISRIQESVLSSAAKQEEAWVKELTADADFGGEKLAESKGAVKAFVQRFAGGDAEKVISLLDDYAISANPMLFKMFARAGAALAQEGKFVGAQGGTAAKQTDEELAQKLFPVSMKD